MAPSCYIVGTVEENVADLGALARALGLAPVETFLDAKAVERRIAENPLAYFFFAPARHLDGLRPIVASIRAVGRAELRFAPLIYFTDTASVDVIRACAVMGFDDVITRPFTRKKVAERLGRQVGRPLVYYETATYFGPDRRGRLTADVPHGRRGEGGEYRRLEILRNPNSGVQVLKDEVHVVI